ncbi:MAG: FAD-binding and (Fe-S)-binding domain-containing protein, partial [Acidobacteriota bacterium]|nr:FAD-binding and (Fe-S)-binding domain-containing protein [Acidobacteriota bacterium]
MRDALRRELEEAVDGEVRFDKVSRALYSTDASVYQIEPLGVVIPRSAEAVVRAVEIAARHEVPITPRGGGTSQAGQSIGAGLVLDTSKHLNRVLEIDPGERWARVEPGVVLDDLNALLRPHNLRFAPDVSSASRATVGGMMANNSSGARSVVYGKTIDHVREQHVVLADGGLARFRPLAPDQLHAARSGDSIEARAYRAIPDLAVRHAAEIDRRFPKVLRRVGGYNLDMVDGAAHNMAHLLVGSEGTLAYSQRIHLNCSPLPGHKTLGVCHFPTFYRAMEAPQHIIKLKPAAVELVDRTMIGLARSNPAFKSTVDRFLKGDPDAILLVEFAGDDKGEQLAKLKQLAELMGDLGLPGEVVEVTDGALQRDIWEVRKAGLNIMMSMKGDGKPVSFIEDCAVPLEHLAEYTDRLTRVFEKHGTRGTWYAHASVGCLHVRPILNMRADGAQKMRAIAEEASAMVREYKGSYSGEHGDGLSRSEWIAPMFGPRIVRAFEEIKAIFDPRDLLNPGKIVRPSNMDDRTLFRYKPDYAVQKIDTVLDWSEHEGDAGHRGGGFAKAIEMCNNNGHCRKFDAGTMCPSFRATGEEQHLTRGRANTLRLAITGQLGPDAFTSDELHATLDLCVSCKGCKRECPTGVDMAKMKIEFLHHYRQRHALSMSQRLIAYLPRYAPWAAKLAWVMNLRDQVPGLAALSESLLGFSSKRSLPKWRNDAFSSATE